MLPFDLDLNFKVNFLQTSLSALGLETSTMFLVSHLGFLKCLDVDAFKVYIQVSKVYILG